MTELEIAKVIANLIHGTRTRRGGAPYMSHIEGVVAGVKGKPMWEAVAYLHDVLEDSEIKDSQLLAAGISQGVVDAVVILTRNYSNENHTSYAEYIIDVCHSGNLAALNVKLADLRWNIGDMPTDKQKARYTLAIPAVEAAINKYLSGAKP